MNMALTCASDAYKFDLRASVVAEGGNVSGTWSETSRNVGGNLQAAAVAAISRLSRSAAGFNANISLRTAGNKQTVDDPRRQPFSAAPISRCRSSARDQPISMPSGPSRGHFSFHQAVFGFASLFAVSLMVLAISKACSLLNAKSCTPLCVVSDSTMMFGLLLGPAGGERGHEIGRCLSVGHGCKISYAAGIKAVTSISTLAL